MRRAVLFPALIALSLLGLAPRAPAHDAADARDEDANSETLPPSFPLPDAGAIAKAVAVNPLSADEIVGVAVARDPSDAATIVGTVINALPARGFADTAGRVAGAAAAAAPTHAPDIAAAAAEAAARAAGKAARMPFRATPAQAVQATLTAAATAAAQVTQSVIVAIAKVPDTRVTADVASAITQRAVVGAMTATAKVATAAAEKAGAAPDEATTLGGQAARLAAETVTRSAIAAATTAVRQAASIDGSETAARAVAPPKTVAQTAAAAAASVADSVTKAAVTASVGQSRGAAVAAASSVADAAVSETSSAVASAAAEAAAEAGATPEEAERTGNEAASQAAQRVGQAAASATFAAAPDIDMNEAAATAGPALAGGITGLQNAQRPAELIGGGQPGFGGGPAQAISHTDMVRQGAAALAVPIGPAPAATNSSRPGPSTLRPQTSDSLFDDPQRALPGLISILAFITVIGIALPWLQPDIFASRLKIITQRRGELSQQRRQRLEQARPSLRRMVSGRVNFMRAVLEKLNVKNLTEQPELRKKLVRAGYRSSQAIITFTFLRLALPLGFAAFSALLLFGGNVAMAAAFKVIICMGCLLFGYMLPDIMVSNAVAKRQKELQKKFPDALDLMVICIESGISLEAAFSRVSEEMAADAMVLSEEIALTTAELAFLSDRRQALENFSERANTPSIKSLVTSLIQSEKYGTPLGAALRVVAQESRDSRMARAEEKAAALPAKLTVPMVTFFLPVLFLVLIGPTIIQVMKAFSGG